MTKQIIFLFLISIPFFSKAQQSATVLFYNVENLFDTIDDPTTRDEEYTPNGKRNWNRYKYYQKINHTYKVLANAGGVNGADIIGLCEIENRLVLNDLIQNTPLQKHQYQIVHHESNDRRGIDVGLLIKPSSVELLESQKIPILFPFDTARTTRDILYAKVILYTKDTLHLFVNHWPSRYGGEEKSRPYRIEAANTLKLVSDSILTANAEANIIIMGDFNDTPYNLSLKKHLGADTTTNAYEAAKLYNLATTIKKGGSHKYQGTWAMLDQMIISGNMCIRENGLTVSPDDFRVYQAPFMMVQDQRYTGDYPFRTYSGLTWQNGYSDHLPISLKLVVK